MIPRDYRRFWLDFELGRIKVLWFRVAFFALLGVDTFLQIEHAPRYGAGGFNVSHIPWLDWLLPEPGRELMLLVYLVQSFLAFAMVFGLGGRLTVALLTTLYGYAYFVSQLDSYQHHYLMFLVLVALCFVPWRQVRERGRARVQSWALRLVLVQMAVVYVWAAASKMDGRWIDGSTLARQISVDWMRGVVEALGGFGTAAVVVLLAELLLAIAVPWRRLWPVALVVGISFHLGVEVSGFQIGLFSYFMVALYLLIVPERWFDRVTWAIDARIVGAAARLHRLEPGAVMIAALAALAVAGGVAVAMVLPYAPMLRIVGASAALVVLLVLAELKYAPGRHALVRGLVAFAVACAAVLTLHQTTEQAFSYHKYWAGSARRLGPEAEARAAYETLAESYPEYGSGHYYLGRYQHQEGNEEAAVASFERAQAVSPDDYRSFLQGALLHHRAGRGAEALADARRVVELAPGNSQHRQLAERLVQRWESAP